VNAVSKVSHIWNITTLCSDGWPDLLASSAGGIQVTIEVKSTIEDSEGHSTCRLPFSF
jgi:hypothetical protein